MRKKKKKKKKKKKRRCGRRGSCIRRHGRAELMNGARGPSGAIHPAG
jgi:hypothetical protein